jgi:hypothetical protein
VSAAVAVFYCPQSGLFARDKTDAVDINVELSATRHSSLGLSFGYGSESDSSLRNDQNAVHGDGFEDFEIKSIANVGVA